MKKYFLLVFLVILSRHLFATAIVIYITPDFVIMAADSKGVYTNAQSYQQTTSIVSKIFKSGPVYFSLAGLTSNDTRHFDVARIVDKELKATTDLTLAIQHAKTAVKDALLVYLRNQKKTNPTLFKNNIASEKYITSIGLITIKNNRPYTQLIGFVVIDGDQLKIKTEEDEYAAGSKSDAVYYLGTSDEINRYMNSIQRNNSNPERFVEKLMNLQASKTPLLVAPPFDIIKITRKAAVWIKRKKGTPVEF